jgi:predicted nucleotidyltransferase
MQKEHDGTARHREAAVPAALGLTQEKMATYRATAQRRREQEQQELTLRKERAWQVAHRAAALLKEQHEATQVMVFGSLVHGYWFSRTSDIDLAAWGLQADDYFVAVAKLQDLSPEFGVDLVAMERCKPELREIIVREGKQL